MANVLRRQPIKRSHPLIVELVGPAGAGKTTLSKALREHNNEIVVGVDIALRKIANIPPFLQSLASAAPILLQHDSHSRAFTWDELKAMAYITKWHRLFTQQAASDGKIILLDHGPIFRLATLVAFGPPQLRSKAAEPWWNMRIREWAQTLDMVIWLDAPDAILEERIRSRTQRHIVKGKSQEEVSQFLEKYRGAYERTLARLNNGNLVIQHFETSRIPIEQIVHQVLAACNAQRNRQKQSV